MAQRITQQRQIYYGVEAPGTEGVDPYLNVNPPAGNALLISNLSMSPDLAFYARSFVGQMGSMTGKIGAQPNPMLSFTVDLKGGGAAGVNPELDPLLSNVFGPQIAGAPGTAF